MTTLEQVLVEEEHEVQFEELIREATVDTVEPYDFQTNN